VKSPPAAPFGIRTDRGYRYYALGLLAVTNLLSFINRNIIFGLFDPIKAGLGISDAQLGWLASAYVLIFSLAALPFGVLSDLRSRRAVITIGVLLWSGFTLASGLANSFGQLLVFRALVGMGAAGFSAAAQSLTADYFPLRGRAVALGILAAGITLGGVIGIWLGGQLEAGYGWRTALIAVSLPGFVLAPLTARLQDPGRETPRVPLRVALKELHVGVSAFVRQFVPLLVSLTLGSALAIYFDQVYGADSKVDVAAFGAMLAVGLALNIRLWVKRFARAPASGPSTLVRAFGEQAVSLAVVLRTPTLGYIFGGGALISFGMNGLVGWAPTFMSRELELTPAKASVMLGTWGLAAGIAGTVMGGVVADWLRTRVQGAKLVTSAIGFFVGAPLLLWLLYIRDMDLFIPVFCAAFFFLTWYNGPLTAVIFDVTPRRIATTVSGVYLMFIHLAGDAVAFPLVGWMSDNFGLEKAIIVLPVASVIGAAIVLSAVKAVDGDTARATA